MELEIEILKPVFVGLSPGLAPFGAEPLFVIEPSLCSVEIPAVVSLSELVGSGFVISEEEMLKVDEARKELIGRSCA